MRSEAGICWESSTFWVHAVCWWHYIFFMIMRPKVASCEYNFVYHCMHVLFVYISTPTPFCALHIGALIPLHDVRPSAWTSRSVFWHAGTECAGVALQPIQQLWYAVFGVKRFLCVQCRGMHAISICMMACPQCCADSRGCDVKKGEQASGCCANLVQYIKSRVWYQEYTTIYSSSVGCLRHKANKKSKICLLSENNFIIII